MPEIDGTDVWSLTKGEIEGRRQALMAIDALRRYTPAASMTPQLRHDHRHPRHPQARSRYELTAADVREQGRFDDSIGIFPEFIDGYGILILPTTGRTRCRTARWFRATGFATSS